MIKVKVNNNIKFPELLLQEDLRKIADKLFIPTLKYNIDKEQDLTESRYPPLAASTIKAKKRYGLSPMILQATGKLRNSFYSRSSGKYKIIIGLSSNRRSVGNILQNVGIRSKVFGTRFFNFFGISTRMEKLAMDYMRKRIDEELKKNA